MSTGATCQERVGRGVITYPCSLPPSHDGPHYAAEVSSSRQERTRWDSGAEARATLAQFQGAAPPVATPTPVPGTNLAPDEYRRQYPPPPPGQMQPSGQGVAAPCTHPFNQVSPVEGGMFCAACGNVVEAPRQQDSLRTFVDEHPAESPSPPTYEDGPVRDRFSELYQSLAKADHDLQGILAKRQDAAEATSTLYEVLLELGTRHPELISYEQVERLMGPIARWVNGE